MDNLSFVAVLISVIPFYVFCFSVAFWIARKVTKYEDFAWHLIETKLIKDNKYSEDIDYQLMYNEAYKLRDALIDQNVNVTFASNLSLDDHEQLLKIYNQLKTTSCNLSNKKMIEESIILISYIADSVFDGSREFFGLKPNLSGWFTKVSTIVKVSLKDSIAKMAELATKYPSNPFLEIVLTLSSNALLYSMNKHARE